MLFKHLTNCLVVVAVGVLATTAPVNAGVNDSGLSASDISAIQRPGSDFFERGREQFEREIERLMQSSSIPNTPLLTIDESVRFEGDSADVIEEMLSSPNSEAAPE